MIYHLKLEIPIYYMYIEYDILDMKHFSRLPRLGCIAWLQRKHLLDFSRSLLVSLDSNLLATASAIGNTHTLT